MVLIIEAASIKSISNSEDKVLRHSVMRAVAIYHLKRNISFLRTICERHSFVVCSENSGLSGRYHAGLWSGKRWSCCRLSTRSAEGCDTCSSWSSKLATNATNPSSTTTSASTTSTSVPGNTVNNTISTTTVTSDHRSQSTNAEANNNPIVQSQTRSTIGSYLTFTTFTRFRPLLQSCN